MSKEIAKKRINQYLDLYNQEQLDLIYSIIKLYSNCTFGKGDIMDLVFSPEEREKIDSAIPQELVQNIKELIPNSQTFYYVYNYNEPHNFGALTHLYEALHIKLHTVLNDSNFDHLEKPIKY